MKINRLFLLNPVFLLIDITGAFPWQYSGYFRDGDVGAQAQRVWGDAYWFHSLIAFGWIGVVGLSTFSSI